MTPPQERLARGLEILSQVYGPPGLALVDRLADVAPDLAEHAVAFGFGEVYDRPGLDRQQRQLVTLGILTALGGCEPQLRLRVGGALNVGLTPHEVVEALLQAAVYWGFPKALNAVAAAREVFAERGLLPLNAVGVDPTSP